MKEYFMHYNKMDTQNKSIMINIFQLNIFELLENL